MTIVGQWRWCEPVDRQRIQMTWLALPRVLGILDSRRNGSVIGLHRPIRIDHPQAFIQQVGAAVSRVGDADIVRRQDVAGAGRSSRAAAAKPSDDGDSSRSRPHPSSHRACSGRGVRGTLVERFEGGIAVASVAVDGCRVIGSRARPIARHQRSRLRPERYVDGHAGLATQVARGHCRHRPRSGTVGTNQSRPRRRGRSRASVNPARSMEKTGPPARLNFDPSGRPHMPGIIVDCICLLAEFDFTGAASRA